MEYGLIGAVLGHSFSRQIHAMLGSYSYELHALPTEDEARAFLAQKAFRAINVTIPYKQLVMEYCDEIDPRARAIGAVNTVVNRGGRLCGYNTDFDGFLYTVRHAGVSLSGKTVLLLGTGGTQHTVAAVAHSEGAGTVLRASRHAGAGALSYGQAALRSDVQILVNTSPAGMYPHNGECLVDLRAYPRLEAVFDVVYNPFRTALLGQAEALGIPAANGLRMLVAQAKYAAEYFLDTAIPLSEVERIYRQLKVQQANLVLIGMPSCGKTSLGKLLAQRLGKPFVDLDAELEKRAGKPISAILIAGDPASEKAFRDLESLVAADVGRESGQVISTGGGVVLRPQNVAALRQNGAVIYVDRPLAQLTPGGGRPLSQSREALERQYAVREPLYRAACHARVANNAPLQSVAAAIEEAFYEVLDSERA